MSASLTPEERSERARIAAYAMHRRNNGREITAKALEASPARMTYWRNKVDPDRTLDPIERDRRAEHARAEHYARLRYKQLRAASVKRAQS